MSDYLSRDEINKLVGELVNIGVSYEEKRDLFLYGIDPGYTTTLPKKGDAQDQILSDLISLGYQSVKNVAQCGDFSRDGPNYQVRLEAN